MLSKFETKSNRVKGISFHPKRPWVLASLHNGTIQLWDYKMGTLVEKFEEHEGPVRGISFHNSQPLFVSGGDDYKIKLWNWKQHRCLYTFNGHLDYIRTVFFHSESPWIISASDDQTIRIWNWQSRTCISILTGHNHYVMCAQFHPRDDLVVSASMDQTVRVWDISGLRKKHAAGSMPSEERSGQPDVFGNTDAVVKYVLEGHSRGVNWAAFHPKQPLIVSCGDDRLVKLWRMNDTKAWEVDTCRGHYSNVSCAIFHPHQDLIISNAEDTTIRIWDMAKRTALQTFRRENNRFWMVTAHPELNIFAAGHDGGLVVFKLERERPAHTLHQDMLFYIRDKYLRVFNFSNGNDVPIITIRRPQPGQSPPPKTLSYNPAENAVIVTSQGEGGIYEVYNLPRDLMNGDVREGSDARRGSGSCAIYVARNRVAVLDKGQILIKDLSNSVIKQITPPIQTTDIFHAGGKNLVLVSPTSVMLFDTELKTNLGEIMISGVRYAVWNNDNTCLALLSKHAISLVNKKFEQTALLHETIRVKSAAWDDSGILIYSTLNHLKFALPNGDTGIIRTIEQPVYILKVSENTIWALNREAQVIPITFDPTEYKFKLALVRRHYDQVFYIIKNSSLVGQSIVAYLQKKGYPEIALQFVRDPKTRFDLAIECGNLDVALEMAKKIEKDEYWHKLGLEAVTQGNHQIVEFVYQRLKQFDKLSFLYLTTGNIEKLKKMHKIAEMRNDTMSRFHNATFLGDVEDQIKMLREVGQSSLAYLTAKTHGLEEVAQEILAEAGLDEGPAIKGGSLLKGPTPILRTDTNWPLLNVTRNIFENVVEKPVEKPVVDQVVPEDVFEDDIGGGWGEEMNSPLEDPELNLDDAQGWGLEDELDLPSEASPTMAKGDVYVAPAPGISIQETWVRNSTTPVDHVAAGSFETAMQLFNRQAGIVNFVPLKSYFLDIFTASKAYMSFNPWLPPLDIPLYRKWQNSSESSPFVSITFATLKAILNEGYGLMTRGKFPDAADAFRKALQQSLLVVIDKNEIEDLNKLKSQCREYLIGLSLTFAKKEVTDPKRSTELAAYFTHCDLQTVHLQLCLNSAMLTSYKAGNLGTALSFARRLLDSNPSATMATSAKKVAAHCERNPTNQVALDYDEKTPFVICGKTLEPIYRGSSSLSCPFCATHYKDYKGICTICDLAQVGQNAVGLKNIK